MIEVTLLKAARGIERAAQNLALSMLNRRSIRNIKKFQKAEEYIMNSQKFLTEMETEIEKEYQRVDAEIVNAYKEVRGS